MKYLYIKFIVAICIISVLAIFLVPFFIFPETDWRSASGALLVCSVLFSTMFYYIWKSISEDLYNKYPPN